MDCTAELCYLLGTPHITVVDHVLIVAISGHGALPHPLCCPLRTRCTPSPTHTQPSCAHARLQVQHKRTCNATDGHTHMHMHRWTHARAHVFSHVQGTSAAAVAQISKKKSGRSSRTTRTKRPWSSPFPSTLLSDRPTPFLPPSVPPHQIPVTSRIPHLSASDLGVNPTSPLLGAPHGVIVRER